MSSAESRDGDGVPSILVVEDRPTERLALAYGLEREGFTVTAVADGPEALAAASAQQFDVVLLDLGLPTLSGFEVCRRLRLSNAVRVVVFSASDAEADRIRSLDLGADDFLMKPLSLTELVARIRAMLRRRLLDRAPLESVRRAGQVTIDLARHEVRVGGALVQTTPSEFKVLALLSEEPGRVYSRTEIVQHLWQSSFVGDRRSCDLHVTNLRRKIDPDPALPSTIVTVRGVGYKLAVERG